MLFEKVGPTTRRCGAWKAARAMDLTLPSRMYKPYLAPLLLDPNGARGLGLVALIHVAGPVVTSCEARAHAVGGDHGVAAAAMRARGPNAKAWNGAAASAWKTQIHSDDSIGRFIRTIHSDTKQNRTALKQSCPTKRRCSHRQWPRKALS